MFYKKSVRLLNICSAWAFYRRKPGLARRLETWAQELKKKSQGSSSMEQY